MRLWAEALDIAHGTRMKLISDETLCRGVTAFGGLAQRAFHGTTEQRQHAAARPICQMGLLPRYTATLPSATQVWEPFCGQVWD